MWDMESPITTRAALLQSLIRGPGFGLELIDRVKEHTKGRVKLHQGTIYPLLRDMEAEGLLESFESEPMPERGGRPRRYYKLTAEGARVATEHRETAIGLFGMERIHA